ncbi:MAG TPA: radical SAM protein [Candidatus Aminicenantes bacterium]|nr:radical SAM protein [Candidatus Aminicenantes bacterium]
MFDSWGRDIHYLRISVTDRCNLRCRYCMPESGIQLKRHTEILSYEKMARVAAAAADMGFWKIRLTGGEPLVRRGVVDLVAMLRAIPKVREIAMTTNGVLLDRYADDLQRAGLDRLNISVDSIDPRRYRMITRVGDLSRVLGGIRAAESAGFQNTKINMVVMQDTTEAEIRALDRFCRERNMRLQRIHHYNLGDHNSIPVSNPAERPLPCNRCNRIRLTADGFLKPCLFSDQMIPVDFQDIRACIQRAIRDKPPAGTSCHAVGNWQIGG